MTKHKTFLTVTLITFLLASVVVVLGAFTRLADAGLGCPDWPTCYGHLWVPDSHEEIQLANQNFSETPVETDKTWPEQAHRLVASTLGLFVFAIFVFAFKNNTGKQKYIVAVLLAGLILGTIMRIKVGPAIEPLLWLLVLVYFLNLIRVNWTEGWNKTPFKLPAILAGLVIVQGLFGMWTVTLKLWPQVVTGHLLGGFATITLLFVLFQRLLDCRWDMRLSATRLKNLKVIAWVGLAAVVMQITLGGWTSANYAALACADFPLCHNELLPKADFKQGFNIFQSIGPNYLGGILDNHARTAIHLSHRLGALLVLAILSVLCVKLLVLKSAKTTRMAVIILTVLSLQILLGIMNVILSLPLNVAVIHNAVGAILLMTLATSLLRIYTIQLDE